MYQDKAGCPYKVLIVVAKRERLNPAHLTVQVFLLMGIQPRVQPK